MKIKLYFGHTCGASHSDRILQSLLWITRDKLVSDHPEWIISEKTGLEGYKDCDLFVGIVDVDNTVFGFELATAISRYGRPVLLVSNQVKHFDWTPFIQVSHPDQIMVRWVESYSLIGEAIAVAIAHFKLDTVHPMAFPCLASSQPSAQYLHEAEIYVDPHTNSPMRAVALAVARETDRELHRPMD